VAGTLETLALVSITIQLQRGKERGLMRGEGDGVAAIVSRSLAGISSGPDTRSLASASRALPRLKTALEPIERYYLFRRARERERETMYARVAIARSFSRALYAALRPSDDYASLYTLRFVNFTSFFWPICGRRRSPGRNGEAD